MKQVNGSIVRDLRKKMGLTQEAFAEKVNVSVRNLFRIETNKAHVDMFQYINMLKIFDQPTDDLSLLFLESVEWDAYKKYITCKECIKNNDKAGFEEALAQLKKCKIYEQPYIYQDIETTRIVAHYWVKGDDRRDDDYNALIAVMKQTIKDFKEENITNYIFAPTEINILDALIISAVQMDNVDHAIELTSNILKNKYLPLITPMYINFVVKHASFYIHKGKYQEALQSFNNIMENFAMDLPFGNLYPFLIDYALVYKLMGAPSSTYEPLLLQGYYLAHLYFGEEHKMMTEIKNALKQYDIDIEQL